MLPEAICPQCQLKWYGKALKERGLHYCPECGEALTLTGRDVYLLENYIRPDRRQTSGQKTSNSTANTL